MTRMQWEVKRQFALDAENESREILAAALRTYATGKDAQTIDVHNSTSWSRTEVVLISAALSAAGDHVKDHHGTSLPSQRLSNGELAFLAPNVPAFGVARFRLSKGQPAAPSAPVSIKDGVLNNGIVHAKIDPVTGDLIEFGHHAKAENLVDTSSGEAVNEYLFLEGSDITKLQKSGPVTISVEEAGPLLASLGIESSAPGCRSLTRRIRLAAGADWIELSNVVDKQRANINPNPNDPAVSREFSQHGGKESVQFAFPFAIPNGKMHLDIPLAEMQPEIDQLPGACKNWLPVGLWIDVANENSGVTWVTLDAPLVEVGSITANLLGSQRDPNLWREHVQPTQKFYSWVMNNHWGTNYRAYQEGPVEFRYALRAHSGYDSAAASRFAIGLSQPLLASAASADPVPVPLLLIEPSDVLALSLKPSNDGKASMVRLFGASGQERRAKLRWFSPTPRQIWISNLAEEPLEQASEEIVVAGWDVVTLRMDRS